MAVTASEIQTLIMDEYNCSDQETVRKNMSIWWRRYDGDRLQELRVRERVLTYLAGQARKNMDVQRGQGRITASQVFKQTTDLLKMVREDITFQGGNAGVFSQNEGHNPYYDGQQNTPGTATGFEDDPRIIATTKP